MSEFLQRLQERLKAKRSAQTRVAGAARPLSSTLTLPTLLIKPQAINNAFAYLLMLITAVIITYWLMQIALIPKPPITSSSGMHKGATLYTNQDPSSAYGLFGSKPLVTDNIYLRGVVITSKNKDGALDGYAIFEIDGKPSNAVSVGESLGKGLSLQSIGDESATLLYQGQKLDFKLSKPGKSTSSNKK